MKNNLPDMQLYSNILQETPATGAVKRALSLSGLHSKEEGNKNG
jgi:hypothetical protein